MLAIDIFSHHTNLDDMIRSHDPEIPMSFGSLTSGV
jgi:hypothetical protein